MRTLKTRVDALETTRRGGLTMLLVAQMPSGETASYGGTTYKQEVGETSEQFRERLGECLKGKGRFVLMSELDAAL